VTLEKIDDDKITKLGGKPISDKIKQRILIEISSILNNLKISNSFEPKLIVVYGCYRVVIFEHFLRLEH
jgi:hypothetical protein